MKAITPIYKKILFISGISLFLISFLPSNIRAQGKQTSVKDETATCTIQVNGKAQSNSKTNVKSKSYELKPNQVGLFNRVANIEPKANIPIEIAYPQGKVGEKVLVSVLDGGKLDNGKGVKVVELNSRKKIAFSFQVATDPGIYRVSLSKGYDTKVVQLWVGVEPVPVKVK